MSGRFTGKLEGASDFQVNFYNGSFACRRFDRCVLMSTIAIKKLHGVSSMTDKNLLEALFAVSEFDFCISCVENVGQTTSTMIQVPSLLL